MSDTLGSSSLYTNWRERARAWAAPGPGSSGFRGSPSSRAGDVVQAGLFNKIKVVTISKS